ncbi:MAG: polyprenyl diphosphate synthase [Candidatus Shapirobacteria bacterium]
MTSQFPPLPAQTLVPHHLAIICDGNRRWARAHNLPNFMGHSKGFDVTPALARAARFYGIHTLSFWAFSTENWDRSPAEIKFLMQKYEWFVSKHLAEAKKEQVRLIHLGRKDRLPASLVKKIIKAEEETKHFTKYVLNIALDYGGRDEIVRAVKKIAGKQELVNLLEEKDFNRFLDTHDQPYPYPDLLIRASGEQRTSGMFCWQGAYEEVYWLPCHFPDFGAEELRQVVLDFSRRRRRFGGNDEIPKFNFDPARIAKAELAYWQKEEVLFNEPYGFISAPAEPPFDPAVVADLAVRCRQIHTELVKTGELDQTLLEKAMLDLYGEIYRLSALQLAEMIRYRLLAISAYRLGQATGEKKYWQSAQNYLVQSYQALRYAAS